jgi:hypothetical protein
MAIFGAAAVMSAASAKEINNFFDGDFPQLIPSVQKLERTGAGFRLPTDLAIAAPASAAREAKLAGDAVSGRFGVCKYHLVPADAKAGMRLVLTEDGVPESPEGYTLSISPAGIEIKARDVRGLFYGAQTFGNIVRNNVVTTLPGCEIVDYPDLGIRGVFVNLRDLKNEDVGAFCQAIRMLAALKYNTLVLEFAENLPMKNNPFTKRKEFLSEESLRKIMDTAEECHCEIIPHLQVLSHDRWMRMHPDHKEKISARVENTPAGEWASSACPEKPLTRELTVYTIDETIRLLKPKRFHLAMDELMHCEWNKCNMCPNGHSVEQLIRETSFYTKLVADKGIEPWVYHDTFCDKDRSGGEAALPYLPKNTVINMWSYLANPTVRYFDFFQDKGFRTTGVSYVATLENLRAIPLACKQYRNLGAIVTYWGYLREYARDTGMDRLAAAGTVLAAEYQWKCSERSVHQWSYDPAWELHRRLGKAPLRRRGSTYADIPVAGVCNAKLGADSRFPKLDEPMVSRIARELAGTPEGFKLNVTADGRIAAAVLSGGRDSYPTRKVTIPVNGFCHGLSLLMTASRPAMPQRLLNQKCQQRIRFFPRLATMTVNYDDGKVQRVPIRYNMELNDWNAVAGGYNCRMVVRGNASDGANYAIYSFDWNNPRTKQKIVSVELSTEKLPERENICSAVALLAVSANIPKGIEVPSAAPGELGEYNVAAAGRNIRKLTAVDFTNGRGKVRFSTEGDFVRPVTTEVVDDPGSPSGKALKVVMPPAKEGSRVPRAIVDVPVPKGLDKLGSVAFSVRADPPAGVRRSAAYFMNPTTELYNVIYNYMRKDIDTWQKFEIPFDMMPPHEPGRGVSLENASTIRVSAWLENSDRDITLWFGPIAASPDETDYEAPPNVCKVD